MGEGPDLLEAGLVVARACHFLACILLFGELLFACVIEPARGLRARVIAGSLALALVFAVAWLALEAIAMSGETPSKALHAPVLGLVLRGTGFGHLWLVRLGLALAVALATSVALHARHARLRRAARGSALVLAGAWLASLAWAGHAGAGVGLQRAVELGADAVHLLAAGAWLGALPALASVLAAAAPGTVLRATRRFSVIGIIGVIAIVASGLVNAWFRVRDPSLLIATDYGRLLLWKLALVAVMLALAAVNRFALTPRLEAGDARAARTLRRNAVIEIAVGVAVVALVGALGITPPPAMMAMPEGHAMPGAHQ